MIGTVRTLRYRRAAGDDGELLPEEGDFVVVETTGTTYRILGAKLTRDVVESWDAGGHESAMDGVLCRVLHFRLRVVRVFPADRPGDAMTWPIVWDKPRRRRR